jgi:septal ring factor EnvC (AmiA/AmiB activator)
MLNKKIEQAEAEEAKQKAKEEQEALKKAESKRRTSSSRRRRTRQNPIVKVLSSPTVIRSVLGILTKMLK